MTVKPTTIGPQIYLGYLHSERFLGLDRVRELHKSQDYLLKEEVSNVEVWMTSASRVSACLDVRASATVTLLCALGVPLFGRRSLVRTSPLVDNGLRPRTLPGSVQREARR